MDRQHTDAEMRDGYEFPYINVTVDDTPDCVEGERHDFSASGQCRRCEVHRSGGNG